MVRTDDTHDKTKPVDFDVTYRHFLCLRAKPKWSTQQQQLPGTESNNSRLLVLAKKHKKTHPTMARKKTNYEKKGIVRQITGSIFASPKDRNQDAKWRPRKNLFEPLGGDGYVFDEDNAISRTFSVESDTQDYRRDILLNKKKAAFDHAKSKKRDLGSIMIKPSVRDKPNSRSAGARTKKVRKEHETSFDDPFGFNPFVTKHHGRSDESVDSASRHTSSSKSTRNTAFHTVSSDPSDFFSKQPGKLTKNNLDLMTSMANELSNSGAEENGIENINPRSKFHQFTVEEDKESTVILPVSYLGEGLSVAGSDDEEMLEEDSQYSLGVTSKGTQIQRGIPGGPPKAKATSKQDSADAFFGLHTKTTNIDSLKDDGSLHKGFENAFFGGFSADAEGGDLLDTDTATNASSTRKLGIRRDPSQQFQSTHSLVYSESSCEDTNDASMTKNGSNRSIRKQIANRNQRTPLSPLNIEPRSRFSTGSSGKYGTGMTSVVKPDPDASWAAFPGMFTKKPDPKADENMIVSAPFGFTEDVTMGTFHQNENQSNTMLKKPARGQEATIDNDFLFNAISQNAWGGRAIPEDRPVDEEDEDDDINDFDPEYDYGYVKRPALEEQTIGIHSCPSYGSSSSHSSKRLETKSHDRHKYRYGFSGDQDSKGSHSRSHHDNSLCSHGLPKSRCCHIEDHDDDDSLGKHSTSSASFTKPLGLPNNAIMASMLFRRHHNIDTQAVEAKLKAKEQEYRTDRSRGDIPQTVQAVDGISCVSEFSEDTAAQIEAWRKPTRDLLEHFSRSRRTEFDYKKHLKEQRTDATELFEA
jgi:hypothetical protein